MTFTGYLQAEVATSGAMVNELVGMAWEYEGRRLYSNAYQIQRGIAAVEAGIPGAGFNIGALQRFRSSLGCHGMCVIFQHLDYLTYNDVWVLGAAHTILLGVVKDFVYLLKGQTEAGVDREVASMAWASLAKRKECRARCLSFKLNVAFGRLFTDLTAKDW